MPSQSVLLAGATGMLGARIAHHLLESGEAHLKLLVRPKTHHDPAKRAVLDPLVDRGAEVVEGDVTDPASLDRPTRDVKAPPGEHLPFDERREADEAIAALGMEHIHVLSGAFLDMLATPGAIVQFDDEAEVATLWGSGDERFEATSVDDTARYAARVALDPSVPSGKFAVAAQRLSLGDIVASVERTSRRHYMRRSRGTAQDLRADIAGQRQAGDEMGATMGTYLLYMLTGEAALDDLQNDRYPDIRPTTLEQRLTAAVGA